MADSADSLAIQIRDGDRRALARGITLVESTRSDHRLQAEALLENLVSESGRAVRVGITGTPGVGKSTFIEALGNRIVDAGGRPAVLTVDPSSTRTGGSILGDKTRMELLSRRREAFIRPSPSGNTLGGVARRTREAMILCEAAGFDSIIVETVGVGQSETTVAQMTDTFVLLLQPGSGDELQGIKRGIMELADVVVVNKADGDQLKIATRAAADYAAALRFLSPRSRDWKVPVMTCSSLNDEGVSEVWARVNEHHSILDRSGELESRRAEQSEAWFWNEASELLISELREERAVAAGLASTIESVRRGTQPATVAARRVISAWRSNDA